MTTITIHGKTHTIGPGANLRGASLRGANLSRANLRGAKGLAEFQVAPEDGAFTAYKKVLGKTAAAVVELFVPEEARPELRGRLSHAWRWSAHETLGGPRGVWRGPCSRPGHRATGDAEVG